ncbi:MULTISPECIES: hypothetical protein [unclassified Bradyrhizobium]|uniref:hypothetical protein n=1 Tax=unclassified Bradyrhizobium TaxID=2631580 RepID=UPI0028EC88F9|nr:MULTISPECIES: hypothetical protein [unclassified Bradyrhizobium]
MTFTLRLQGRVGVLGCCPHQSNIITRDAFPDPLIVPRASGQRKRAVCRKAKRRASLRAVWNLICRCAE